LLLLIVEAVVLVLVEPLKRIEGLVHHGHGPEVSKQLKDVICHVAHKKKSLLVSVFWFSKFLAVKIDDSFPVSSSLERLDLCE
jgi:hypothetical protein